METILLVTLFTTLVTVLQTVLMWYFTKHVELDDEEVVPIEFATKNYVDEHFSTIQDAFGAQIDCIEALDEDVAELLNSRGAIKERVDALQELSNALLEAIEGVDENITELQEAEAHRATNQESATQILAAMEHTVPFVHPTPPTIEPVAQPERPSIRSTRPGPPRPEHSRTMRVPEELLMDNEDTQIPFDGDRSEVEPLISDNLLKPPRKEGDPMIMDLRAAPFEEAQDSYGNIHELPPSGDYEEWGTKGARRPRNRGFRRI